MKTAINDLVFDNVKTNKFFKNEAFEAIAISIEKGKVLKKHVSPKDASLVVLEGEINFVINGESIHLKPLENFAFEKEVEHEVLAIENAKFIIIR